MASQNLNLSQTPAGVPPPGVVSNLDHPQGTLFAPVVGVGVVMLALCLFTVILSTTQRLGNALRLSAADWIRLLGLLFTVGYSSVVFALARSAIHQWDLRTSWYNVPAHIKLLYSETLLLSPCIFFSKLSILLFYFEVFQVKRAMRVFIWAGIVFDVLTYWPGPFLVSYYCAPHVGSEWDIVTYGHCEKTVIWGVVQGTLATTLDIYIFVLPLPTIWSLQMTNARKLAVTAIFGTAALGIVASLAALAYRVKLFIGNISEDTDFNWLIYQSLICVMVENGVALLVSSMPAASTQIKRLFDHYNELWSYVSSKVSSSKDTLPGSPHNAESGIVRVDSYQVEFKGAEHDDQLNDTLNQSPVKPFEQMYGRIGSS